MSAAVTPEPPPPPPPPAASGTSFDFLKPLTFVFDDPRWMVKILIGGLFVIASFFIIGVFFLVGYMAQLARNVIAGMQYPLPEWDDLGGYFVNGVKLICVGLVYAVPIMILVALIVVPTAIMGSSADNETIRSVAGMSMAFVWCLIFPFALALGVWMPAALLMVIVSDRFGAGFEFRHIFDFIRANIGNYLLSIVVAFVAGFAAQLGIILCVIGVIFTGFWARVVATYAFAQTYRLSSVK